jgi:hypothetical protein
MFKGKVTLFVYLAVFLVAMFGNCSKSGIITGNNTTGRGVALLKIKVTTGSIFQRLAHSATLTVSASDMLTITQNLTITDTSVEGTVAGIPAGKSRLFSLSVYDSLDTLQYQGSSTANVIADSTVYITITVVRVSGKAVINGVVDEGDTIPTNGLLGYWPFTGNANDSSGHGYIGTVANSFLVPDRFGNSNRAYKSNGGRITVENFIFDGTTGSMTLSAWIMPDSAWGSNSNFTESVLAHNWGSFSFFIEQQDTGRGSLHTWVFKTYQQGNPDAMVVFNFAKNKWHHIAVVSKVNQEMVAYIDNQKFFTGTMCPDSIYTSTAQLMIGGGISGSYLNGCFDDVRIYNSPLTDSQISALYHEGGWTGN